MALFQNLFKPPPPRPAPVPPVPPQLPKITAPTAAQIAQTSHPSPEAQAILQANPQQTPAQYLGTLQEKQMGGEMVKTLAHGMPDREGVHWAAQSAGKVSDKLPPSDAEAMKAAQAWAKNPTPENKAAAAAAAAKTNYRGPGALAAQGAAWAQPATQASSGATANADASAAPRMTPHAVAGAVLLSAAIKANPAVAVPTLQAPTVAPPTLAMPAVQAPQLNVPPAPPPTVPPAVQAQTFKDQHPFIAMGLDIASGKSA
jgi:hypothetical protein